MINNVSDIVPLTFQSFLPTYSYSALLLYEITTDFIFIFTESMNGKTTLTFTSFRANLKQKKLT